jgi:tetratricopeptide (TPR) repeat protein
MSTWPGFSGSPVFLPNGRVAAVHNTGRLVERGKDKVVRQSIPHGVRIDCVLEMLVHHGLEEKVPFAIDKSKLSIERWLAQDERSDKARADFARAETLAQEAGKLVFVTNDFAAGEAKANEAIELAPKLALAYYVLGMARMRFQFHHHDELSEERSLALLESSMKLFQKACQLNPAELYYPRAVCSALNNFGRVTGDKRYNEKALGVLNDLLTAENLTPPLRALIFSSRGVALDNLGDDDNALRDHNEAVRLDPSVSILETRAGFHEQNGDYALARADRARIQALRQK